jgi:septal ring factor EnvC (AmiA/AmiB activator)
MEQYSLAVREGFRNFLRARTLSLALTGCIAVAVFAVGAFGLVALNVSHMLNEWEGRVEMVAFLSSDTSEQEAGRLLDAILDDQGVGEARVVTGRESWEELFAGTGVSLDLNDIPLDEVLSNALIVRPASGSREIDSIRQIALRIASLEGVDEVKFEEALIERYIELRRELAVFTGGTSVFLVLVFGVITVNIAGLASAARRGEVRALRTLGASAKFIRRVFSVEGIAQGLAGSVVGMGVLLLAALFVSRRIGSEAYLPPKLFAAVFAVGPMLGILSSMFLLRNTLTVAFAIFIAIIPATAFAQAGETLEEEISQNRQKLEKLEDGLKENREAAEKISERELAVIDEVEWLDRELDSLSRKIKSAEKNIASNRAAAEKAKAGMESRKAEVTQSRKELGQWLRLLCNEREPAMVEVILQDIPHSEITRRREIISRLAGKQAEALELTERVYRDYLDRRDELDSRLELNVLYTETAKLEARQSREKKERREALLARLREKKNIYAALIKDLEASARRLQDMVETERGQGLLVFAESVPFRDMKGLLPWPADGEIAVPYGGVRNPDSPTYVRRRGIDFSAPAGSQISAIHDASVAYCDWFRGYGKLVILDHGGGYNSVYAHCSDILVEKGNLVRAGHPIALVGDTGSLKGSFLYFEIREQGRPVDPAFWLQRRNIDATRSR